MSLGAVTSIASALPITWGKSPRYGGGDGPLYSTVNAFLDRVATGELAVIRQLDGLRKTDADKVQWQKLWDEMVPLQPLTAAQVKLIQELDPSKSGLVAHGGDVIRAQPGVQPPTLDQVLRGIVHTVQAKPDTGNPGTSNDKTPALSNPMSALRASTGGLPLWGVLLLAGVAGWAVYKAVRKG